MIEKALSADGNWIVAVTADMTFDNDVTVDGEFHDKGDDSADIYRKFALYSQDEDRNVTAEYTVTVPKLIVNSENFNIVHGVIKGDVEVNANGFVLNGAKVEGNVTFTSKEFQDSATLDEDGASVTANNLSLVFCEKKKKKTRLASRSLIPCQLFLFFYKQLHPLSLLTLCK